MKFSRRDFIKKPRLLLPDFTFSSCNASHKHPNILFIMADDHTAQAINADKGIFTELAATHNIDRIAHTGTRQENCFCANSICSPSLATKLSGQYSYINGVRCLGQSSLANFKGKTPANWPDAAYYHYWQHTLHRNVAAHLSIRTRDKKLIFYYGLPLGQTDYPPTGPEWELFDLANDPHEMNNVYDHPENADWSVN